MNKKLYRLQQIGERLWSLATTAAMISAGLGRDGRGFAIVADEIRNIAGKIQSQVEKALFDGEEAEPGNLKDAAHEIMNLALNAAIESHRLDIQGKQAAVCAEEIRSQAYLLTTEISEDIPLDRLPDMIIPWAKAPLTTIVSHNHCFILLKTADTFFAENLINIKEVLYGLPENENKNIVLRGVEIPLINTPKLLKTTSENPAYLILQAPWAEENKEYAVAVDTFGCLFYSPIGTPVAPPADTPLAEYIREYWESENETPFLFMDWPAMAALDR